MSRTRTALALTGAAVCASLALPASAGAAHEELVVTGLTQNDKLVTFVAGTGQRLSQLKVSGVAAGQRLVALDYRPATGDLYGLAVDASAGYLYVVDDETGRATRIGTDSIPVSGAVSIDFNPTVDRLRVVSTDRDNLRVNPATGAATVDTDLTYGVVDAAYTNSAAGATATTLYDIDGTADALVKQDPPNLGVFTPVGALGIDVDEATGFDVYSENGGNIALLSTRTADGTLVYTVNTTTGAVNRTATSGVRVQGAPVVDIAVAPGQ